MTGKFRRYVRRGDSILAIVLAVIITTFGIITQGRTLSSSNITITLLQSSTRGIASMGQMFVILTGGLDLSVGGIAMLCTTFGAALMTSNLHYSIIGYPLSPYQTIPLMLLLGVGIGSFNGFFVARLHVPPLISTLAVWQIAEGLGYQITEGASILQLPRSLAFWGQGAILGVPVPTMMFIILCVISYIVLYHTTFGREIHAVGGNPVGAWLSGFNVRQVLALVYSISGLMAALASIVLIGRTLGGSTLNASGLELETVAAVCIGGVSLSGGRGSIIGVVMGVIMLGVINNGMVVMGISRKLHDITTGVIILTAVAVDTVRRRGLYKAAGDKDRNPL
jgi:ribose/xylose/arabinose/galactoside ABC-type transport system permease subunit